MMKHDVLIIGGGSAGYAAARTARDAGLDVGIVDHGPLGGLCILRGCMPSKTILRSSDIMALMRRVKEFGLSPVDVKADLDAIIERKNSIIGEFADYRIKELNDSRFTLYEERAAFHSPIEVTVGHRIVTAQHVVIATGSVPANIPVPGLDDVGYLTSDDVLDLRAMPKAMMVLGGGSVASELGQFYSRIGVPVTLLQRSPHILSCHDEDIASPVEAAFRDEGMSVFCGTNLQKFTRNNGVVTAHFEHGGHVQTAFAEVVFQALGRWPNINGLNLEAAGVTVHEGKVVVDSEMRTSQPHIYAVGDVTGLHDIVHIAIQQGEIAAHNIAHPSTPQSFDSRLVAEVVFTDPQVASVGLNEKQCRAQGVEYLAATYPFADHGKAICLGQTYGHVKLLCQPATGKVLGAQIVGPEAGELLHELIAVMYFHGTVQDIMRMPHYHPTLAEIVTYPAEELAGRLARTED